MSRSAKFNLIAFAAGIVFGVGLAIGRMIDPQKILNFLDVAAIPAGGWDPSLAFVMGGAVIVSFLAMAIGRRRAVPVLAEAFHHPPPAKVDMPLLSGSALFGVGWGLAGFCPGPAIANLGVIPIEVALFVGAMLAGSWATGLVLARRGAARAPAAAE